MRWLLLFTHLLCQIEVAELLEDAQDTGNLLHTPGQMRDFVRGSTSNRPFRPGGLDDSQSSERLLPEGVHTGQWLREIIDGGEAQTVPPSFKHGMNLGSLKVSSGMRYSLHTLHELALRGNSFYLQKLSYLVNLSLYVLKGYPYRWKSFKERCSGPSSATEENIVSYCSSHIPNIFSDSLVNWFSLIFYVVKLEF